MSEKGSKGLREMTTGCALAGFLMPILVMIVLIVLGAEMTIASLAALFVMIGFCMFMGFKWERLDAAMAEGVRQVATAAMIMLLVGCMVAAWISSGTIPTLLYYGMKIITPKLFLPICFIVPAAIPHKTTPIVLMEPQLVPVHIAINAGTIKQVLYQIQHY